MAALQLLLGYGQVFGEWGYHPKKDTSERLDGYQIFPFYLITCDGISYTLLGKMSKMSWVS
jgi:hypothetical protein